MTAHLTNLKSVSLPDPTVLDAEVVEQLRELGAFEEIGRAYLEDLPAQLTALRDAVIRRDMTATWQIAHSVKGASASTGAKGVAEASGEMERIARSGTLEGVDELLTNVERNYGSLKSAFEKAWA